MAWDDQSGKGSIPSDAYTTSNPSIASAQQTRTQKNWGDLAGEQDGSVGNRWLSCGVGHSLAFLIDDPSILYRSGEKWMSANMRTVMHYVLGRQILFNSACVCTRPQDT